LAKNYLWWGTISDETNREGIEDPIHYWIPSTAPSGI